MLTILSVASSSSDEIEGKSKSNFRSFGALALPSLRSMYVVYQAHRLESEENRNKPKTYYVDGIDLDLNEIQQCNEGDRP